MQTDIEHGVSVYDEQFAQQRERFGEAFVHEYLSEVATQMAVHIVRAFEEHDRKRYQRCAQSFGTVYVFLFPVSVRAAQTADTSYALALKHHDVIEDGVHAVVTDDPIVNGSVAEDPARMTVLYDQILAAVVDMDPLDRRISEEVARRIQR